MNRNTLVLVVDDDQSARLIMKRALEQTGVNIVEAVNGREALCLFEKIRPDLVLLDVNMPEMDGFEACMRLRENANSVSVPVMIITDTDASEDIRKAYDSGATDFMSKPISSIILRERVGYMLRANATARQLHQSQELLAKAQTVARMGSFFYEPNGSKLRVSETFQTIFTHPVENLSVTRDSFWEKIHPEDLKALQPSLQRLQAEGGNFQQDVRLIEANRVVRFAMLQIEAEADKNGKVVRLIGIVQDITERKLSELLERDKNQVMQRIVRRDALTKIFLEITRLLERQRPHSLAAICQVENGRIEKMFASSLPARFCESLEYASTRRMGWKVTFCTKTRTLPCILPKIRGATGSSFLTAKCMRG